MRAIPPRIERLQGEQVEFGNVKFQRERFLRECVVAGLDDDEIIILSRHHAPCTETQYDSSNEPFIEKLLAKVRESIVSESDSANFLDWSAPEGDSGEPDWCIDGWFERGESVSLVGPPKVGKSLLTLEAAASKAAGVDFLGYELRPAPVLYLDYENRPRVVRARLEAMGFQMDQLSGLHYLCPPPLATLDSRLGADQMLKLVKDIGAELVVIDTLQRVLSGEENSSQGIRDLYRLLIAPLRTANVATLRLDHLGKGSQSSPRGSSAKSDDVDQAWLLRPRQDSSLSLRRSLSRSYGGSDSYVLRRNSKSLRHEVVHGASDTDSDLVDSSAATVDEVVAVLDDLDVPNTVGRPRAVQALKTAGRSFSTDVVAEAVKTRKARP